MSTKITVNGTSYDSIDAMPPDVRQLYEQAMEKAKTLATKNEIKITFQVQGPHFSIHKSLGTSTPAPISLTAGPSSEPHEPTPMPKPIEPGAGTGSRLLLIVAAGVGAGLLFWLMRAH